MHLVPIPATQQIHDHDSHLLKVSIHLHISELLSLVNSRKLELPPHPLPQLKCTPITEGEISVSQVSSSKLHISPVGSLNTSVLLPATATPMQQGSNLHICATSLDIAAHTVIHPTGCSWHTTERLLFLALEYPRTNSGSGQPRTDCCHFHCKVSLHCYQWLHFFYASFKLTPFLFKNTPFQFLGLTWVVANFLFSVVIFLQSLFWANNLMAGCPSGIYSAPSSSCLSNCGSSGCFAKDVVSIPQIPEGHWLSEGQAECQQLERKRKINKLSEKMSKKGQ